MKAETDIKDKILFANIFDLIAKYYIIRSMNRYRPRVAIYGMSVDTIVFLNQYFIKNLPDIHVKTPKPLNIDIDDNKNVMPLLMHIRPNCRFKTHEIDTLIGFIHHRTETAKKRYDIIDEDFFKTIYRL